MALAFLKDSKIVEWYDHTISLDAANVVGTDALFRARPLVALLRLLSILAEDTMLAATRRYSCIPGASLPDPST
jgi:hypothetical protein